ncbi:MAG TPA: TlpA disulfide reductase family protein [Pyrinomonadaceae bacterium]|jgi:thiol-disulfide isomerase/thioredoxin|nr:TlpA disulfide reductase family protein [Pyrinomonadaceae bacterium]
MRRLTTLIFALTLACAVTARARAQGNEAQARQKDAAAQGGGEGFRLKGLDGKFYDTSEMRGDVVVVSFGATWCVPCTWELVAIEELKVEYKGRPVRFMWVNIEDPKRTTNNILKYYVKDRRLTIPVLRDPGGAVLARYESTSTRIPVMVMFDREGRLSAPVHKGMPQDIVLYKQMVRERVNSLLGAGAAAAAGGGTITVGK